MEILVQPSYFASISTYVAIANASKVSFEINDNFQKQTNRNRMYIHSPNGLQMLNVPIKHSGEIHQKTKDIRIENDFNWQKQHFKSLEAAYRSSPFFEYFEDQLLPIFTKKHTFLLDLNFETTSFIYSSLRLNNDFLKTTEYLQISAETDFRNLVNGKKDTSTFTAYPQVFQEKVGFLNNLSVLDLIFNEGKFALEYLKNQYNNLIKTDL
ncbi:MAG: WbqC family protein [Flavobacterium sp.]|nr:WbqC family protein [Flavobacterium sp.]